MLCRRAKCISMYPNRHGSRLELLEPTTMNLQKFDDGWKIVVSHTSIAET